MAHGKPSSKQASQAASVRDQFRQIEREVLQALGRGSSEIRTDGIPLNSSRPEVRIIFRDHRYFVVEASGSNSFQCQGRMAPLNGQILDLSCQNLFYSQGAQILDRAQGAPGGMEKMRDASLRFSEFQYSSGVTEILLVKAALAFGADRGQTETCAVADVCLDLKVPKFGKIKLSETWNQRTKKSDLMMPASEVIVLPVAVHSNRPTEKISEESSEHQINEFGFQATEHSTR